MKRLRAIVTGRVQGVGYRASVQKRISLLGVTGYVKNLPDGSVEIVAEGLDDALNDVLDISMKGSAWSSVEKIDTEYTDAKCEFSDFTIAY